MFDFDALSQAYAAQAGANPQGTAMQAPKKKKKNFWLDQISTAGGILGGIGGSFLSPIAGTAAGAGAGSALGEAIEKLIDPSSTDWGNVAQEGAIGAVMGAGPIKLLKGAGALATGKGIEAASQAALTPLRQTAGKAISGAADDLAVKNFRFTPTQLNNFKNKFGEDVGGVLRKYGIQNADDVALKGIEPLQQQFDNAITGITGVTKDSLKTNLMKRAEALAKSGPSDSKALGKNLKAEIDSLLKGRGDVLDAKELNTIRRQFDSLVNYTEKTANPARYGVNKRMADGIRETLQQADQTGGLKDVGRELQKLRQLSDNIAKQGQLGRGSLPLSIGNLPGAVMGAGAGGPGGAAVGYVANAVANSPTGRRAAMIGADKLGGKLAASGAKAAGQSLGGIAGRVGATGALRGLQGQQPQTLEDAMNQSLENRFTSDTTTNTSMNMPNSSAMMGGGYQNTPEMSNSPFSRESILSAMIVDLQETGGKNMDKIQALYKFANPEGDKQKLNATQIQQSNNAVSALQDLDQISAGLQRDPQSALKANLPGGSFTQRLTGTTDFEAARKNIGDVLARLRSGAAITNDEYKRYLQLLPASFDSPDAAQNKISRLRELLVSFASPSSSSQSLEDALMSAQSSYQ